MLFTDFDSIGLSADDEHEYLTKLSSSELTTLKATARVKGQQLRRKRNEAMIGWPDPEECSRLEAQRAKVRRIFTACEQILKQRL